MDKKTKVDLKYKATNTKNRIKAILNCLNIDDKRLSLSIQKMLKEFMNCFPLKDFWKHVLIIRTLVRKKILKKAGNLEKSVIKKMGQYLDGKNIAYFFQEIKFIKNK